MNQLPESLKHNIRRLPKSLPVVVIEVFSSDISLISANIFKNEWAILVCRRQLFVWNCTQESSIIKTCYELQLPASDVAHKADLVTLLFPNDKQINSIPSVLAVSPEGIIRYWPKVANDSNFTEVVANELQGQECNLLINIFPYGCILGTTTNSLVQININSNISTLNNANILTCRIMKIPQGVFAGFKKFSSFIFGGNPNSLYFENKNLIKVLRGAKSDNCINLYVFTSTIMHVWEIYQNSDKLIDEIDLNQILKEGVLKFIWNKGANQIDEFSILIVDAKYKSISNEIIILFGCQNKEISNKIHYILAKVVQEKNVQYSQPNNSNILQVKYVVKNMILLKNFTTVFNSNNEQSYLNLKILPETSFKNLHYVYDKSKIICVHDSKDVVDRIFMVSENDIISLGILNDQPLIFTKDSLLTVTPNEELKDSKVNSQFSTSNNVEESFDLDKYYWLKKSFNLYIKQDTQSCQKLINENFLNDCMDSELNQHVVTLSADLANSTSNTDPRWAETSKNANLSVVSVLLKNQLEEKFSVHKTLINFLKDNEIWDKLTIYTADSRVIPTQLLLCEHAEKIIASNALKNLEEEFGDIIEKSIQIVLQNRGINVTGNLTIHDLFYKEITLINEIIPVLFEYQLNYLSSNDITSKEIFNFIISISVIYTTIFHEVSHFRKNKNYFNEALKESVKYSEYMHWTSTSGSDGIRTILLKQIELLVNYGIEFKLKPGTMSNDEDLQVKTLIYDNLIDLTDIVLDGYIYQLKSLKPEFERYKIVKKEFENDRSKCIRPLIKVKQYERALGLAEKYEDFDTLITICELLEHNDRLNRYRIEYEDKGFSDYLFKWYLKEGKQYKMLSNSSPHLGKFLENHDNLYWMYAIQNNQFTKAGECLLNLALNENNSVNKKKSYLTNSKLCFLADGMSKNNDSMRKIIKEHEIISYQEKLPNHLKPNDNRPLSEYEMIYLLTDIKDGSISENEFKYAFDLSLYLKNDQNTFKKLQRKILTSAILKDSWDSYNLEDPLSYINNTLFCKLIKKCFLSDDNIISYLPSCDNLIEWPEFEILENKNNFFYLMKVLYENYINKIIEFEKC